MSSKRHSAILVSAAALIAGTALQVGCQVDSVAPTVDTPDTPEMPPGPEATMQMSPTAGPASSSSSGGEGGASAGVGGDTSSAGGTTGEGGSGGTPIPSDGTDLCGGQQVSVELGFSQAFDGNTLVANGDYSSPCELASGPDQVYRLDVGAEGTMSLVLYALDGQDLSMYLRSSCEDAATAIECRNHDPGMLTESIVRNVAAGTYYLIVDTEGDTQGRYQLSVAFAAGECGDRAINAGEQCDDGNGVLGDGCDADCQLEPGSNDTCADPQGPVAISPGHTLLTGATSGNTAAHGFDEVGCNMFDYGGARERVVAISPQVSGEVRMTLGYDVTGTVALCEQDLFGIGCWDRVMHVRHAAGDASEAACQDVANQIACDDIGEDPSYVQDLTFDVVANETYFVFIDSYWDGDVNPAWASGPYNLHIDLTAAATHGGSGGAGGAGGGGG